MDGCDPATISDSQYCYTIPDIYAAYDKFDYNDQWYHGIEAIHVGATITMSKICAPDYQYPGTYYRNKEEDAIGRQDCADIHRLWNSHSSPDHGPNTCLNGLSVDKLSAHLVHTPNGYINALNCPQCGCTETDIVTMDEREAGTA